MFGVKKNNFPNKRSGSNNDYKITVETLTRQQIQKRKWYSKNKERLKQNREINKEKRKEMYRKWYFKNREKTIAKNKNWFEKNREKMNTSRRKYRTENNEVINARRRELFHSRKNKGKNIQNNVKIKVSKIEVENSSWIDPLFS